MIPCSLAAEYIDLNLNPSRKPLPFWLDSILLEGAMQLAGKEKLSRVLPITGPCILQY